MSAAGTPVARIGRWCLIATLVAFAFVLRTSVLAQQETAGWCCVAYGRLCEQVASPAACLGRNGLVFSPNVDICDTGCVVFTPRVKEVSSSSVSVASVASSSASSRFSSVGTVAPSSTSSATVTAPSTPAGSFYYCCDSVTRSCTGVPESIVIDAGGQTLSLPDGCQNIDPKHVGQPDARFTPQGPYISPTVCGYFCAQVQTVTTPIASISSSVSSRSSVASSVSSSISSVSSESTVWLQSSSVILVTQSSRRSAQRSLPPSSVSRSDAVVSSGVSSVSVSSVQTSSEPTTPLVSDFYCSRLIGGRTCDIVQSNDSLNTGTIFFSWPQTLCSPLCAALQNLVFCAHPKAFSCTVVPVEQCVGEGYVAFSTAVNAPQCEHIRSNVLRQEGL